jgi:hypothetical protein
VKLGVLVAGDETVVKVAVGTGWGLVGLFFGTPQAWMPPRMSTPNKVTVKKGFIFIPPILAPPLARGTIPTVQI